MGRKRMISVSRWELLEADLTAIDRKVGAAVALAASLWWERGRAGPGARGIGKGQRLAPPGVGGGRGPWSLMAQA